jgi:hypothetical protein
VTFFITHTLFVILDIFNIPDEFGGKLFFLKKALLDFELFNENVVTRTFTAFFHIDEYFDMQEQFSIQKFPIRDVLNIEYLASFAVNRR